MTKQITQQNEVKVPPPKDQVSSNSEVQLPPKRPILVLGGPGGIAWLAGDNPPPTAP